MVKPKRIRSFICILEISIWIFAALPYPPLEFAFINQNKEEDSMYRHLRTKWIYTSKHSDILTSLKFVRRGMIKGLMKAEYYGKKDRSSEGFYGIGDSYPKKLCWSKVSKSTSSCPLYPIAKWTSTGQRVKQYWSQFWPVLLCMWTSTAHVVDQYW